MSRIALFQNEAYRRKWENSIGISRNTPKAQKNSIEVDRQFINPLKQEVNLTHRPVSPLLNLEADRTDVDEYADVAGHFFSDVMTTRVRSRTGKRPLNKKSKADCNLAEKIYAPPTSLPQLKGKKHAGAAVQTEKISTFFENSRSLFSSSKMLGRCRSASSMGDTSVPFDSKSLFDDDLSTCLSRFEHNPYVMIPGKLYKFEDTIDSVDFEDKACADMFIPYNIALLHLKNTIMDILYGKGKLKKKHFQKALRNLKVWIYQTKKHQWLLLTCQSEWSHSLLLAQEDSENLKLMFSLDYKPPKTSKNDEDDNTTILSAKSANTSKLTESSSPQDMKNLRLECYTPNPPNIEIGSMLLLKNDALISKEPCLFDTVPKEQGMANILESRLMKSRY